MNTLKLVAIRVIPVYLAIMPSVQAADSDQAIAFDRPGIGFGTSTVPVNQLAWEQGLPDFSYTKEKQAGQTSKTTVYQADTLLRTGLAEHVELQLGWQGANWSRQSSSTGTQHQSGYADSSIGLKASIPLASQPWSLAVLLASTLPTGDAVFGSDHKTLSLGSSLNYELSDGCTAAMYANLDRQDGHNTWSVSPSISQNFNQNVGGFVEYGYNKASGQAQQSVMGGGFTWMIKPKIQLDVSADLGLNHQSPDVQGGLGLSFWFP